MRYFVTGGTGFLGGALARQLRAAGHDVVALVRDLSRAYEPRPLEEGLRLTLGLPS